MVRGWVMATVITQPSTLTLYSNYPNSLDWISSTIRYSYSVHFQNPNKFGIHQMVHFQNQNIFGPLPNTVTPLISGIIEIIIRQWWVMVDSVSISITSAIVYGVSGGLFFLLIFLLILIGLCNCNCDNYRCGEYRKTRRSIYAPSVLIPTKGQRAKRKS